MPSRKSKHVWEFGDFQTPAHLATSICRMLERAGIVPLSVLEPTCGRGAFVKAAATAFPEAHLVGVDINSRHLSAARDQLTSEQGVQVELIEGDFFELDWASVLGSRLGPWLILGNPPWVTSAELGVLASENLPGKTNFHGRRGIEALTGKSNFDISEWMVLRYLDWLRERGGWVAVLVKTMVARKVLLQAWKDRYPLKGAAIYPINAMEHFGAAVDACLFVLTVEPSAVSFDCSVFEKLEADEPSYAFGFHDGFLIAEVASYLRWHHLAGRDRHYIWRSGIKHDCSKVMELTAEDGHFRNGFDEEVVVEDALVYPLLKSSDVNKGGNGRRRVMLVPQRRPGDDTDLLRSSAPLAWAYLQHHRSHLDARASSIYRNRPPFSIFGVGDYSFAPWKVAISGFYKSLRFMPIGPVAGRPTVFDDTVYFLSCRSQLEAEFLTDLLNSAPARQFLGSMVFWSDKRPITIELLRRLDIARLAAELGKSDVYSSFLREHIGWGQEAQLPLIAG